LQAALAARDWLTIEWLPKYAPKLNDIERSWRDLKRHFLAHQTFADVDDLDRAIHNAITDMNHERQPPPDGLKSSAEFVGIDSHTAAIGGLCWLPTTQTRSSGTLCCSARDWTPAASNNRPRLRPRRWR
jgi:hypothetical protein